MPFIPNEPDAFHISQSAPDSGDFDVLRDGSKATGVVSGCAVTAQGSPDMTCAVASGTIAVGGVTASVSSGNVTITTADPDDPRIDLVVASNAGVKSVVAGDPAPEMVSGSEPGPDYPAIPANSVVLAAVYVPAADTTIASNQITDKRVMLADLVHTHSHDTDLTGVSADDHHAQSHTHASHTSIGANDHHADIHQPSKHDAIGAHATKSAIQSIPNNTNTIVTFNTEIFDTDGLHDNVTNNSRLTIPSGMGGLWLAGYSVEYYQQAGRRLAEIRKNGGGFYARMDITATLNQDLTFGHSIAFYLNAGDYLELNVLQASGVSIDLLQNATGLWAVYLGA